MGYDVVPWLEYGLLRTLESSLSRLSWEGRTRLGRGVGRVWHRVDARHRAVARDNVTRAFPDWSGEQIAALVRANFEHLGAVAAEFLGLPGVTPEALLERYRFEGVEHLEEARSLGRGVLFLTGHVGNWELASPAMAAAGYPLHAVAKRLANERVDRHVTELRAQFGTGLIHHRNAARPVLRALREGRMVAFLMDQKPLAREAVASTFFGQRVATNQGLALLALKSGAPVVPGFDERVEGGHLLRLSPALEPPPEGPLEERVQRYTEAFDAAIEAAVRRRPEQWFWVHRRWRLPGGMDS